MTVRFEVTQKGPGLIAILGLFCVIGILPAGHSNAESQPLPLASPSVPGPQESPAVLNPMLKNAAEAKKLSQQFARAQANEIEALRHRQKIELKELKASHSAREKEWNQKEKLKRHEFFSANKGAARRTYMKDFLVRREAFVKILKEERLQREREYDIRLKSVQQDQAGKFKEFKDLVSKGVRPPSRLWP